MAVNTKPVVMKSPSNDQQMRPTDETQEVNQSINDNNNDVNEDMFAINGLELGTVIKEEPEDYSLEPMNTQLINKSSISLMNTEMQTQVNSTSKPSTSQSSQEMVNIDSNEDLTEISLIESMSQFLCKNKSERQKCFDLNTNAFICPINECHMCFQTDNNFVKHFYRKHTSRQYKCTHEGCGKAYKTIDGLKKHVLVHKNIKSFHCPHNGCQYKASCEEYLKRHLKRHSTDKVLRCDVNGCDYKTCHNEYLSKHMKTHHNIIKSYECHYNGCQYKCVNNKLLTSHLKTHSTVGIVEVSTCTVSDCQTALLNVYRLTHGSEPIITCGVDGCNYMSHTYSQRVRHRVSVHSRRSHSYRRGKQCEWKAKTTTQEVMQTMRDNTEGVNEDMFDNNSKPVETRLIVGKSQSLELKCGVTDCQMIFASKEDLYKHLDKHMNDLELRSVVCEEPENNCVEPLNTEMETLLNSTSKPSTSQSSQQLVVNEDIN
ncbi:unnamed protein product [Medioppia subpectinata]|uniref:C2H2-type domain-containing protein n=1 Tax=Medioppia subpectinata TaxID=1979941 RepID=A0A7R9PY03_9ACAR|nr:unnamed protein product [Medioppia subpectinata]CAG2104919.1 unnamed protein product [Medioppia subpectinata]